MFKKGCVTYPRKKRTMRPVILIVWHNGYKLMVKISRSSGTSTLLKSNKSNIYEFPKEYYHGY